MASPSALDMGPSGLRRAILPVMTAACSEMAATVSSRMATVVWAQGRRRCCYGFLGRSRPGATSRRRRGRGAGVRLGVPVRSRYGFHLGCGGPSCP